MKNLITSPCSLGLILWGFAAFFLSAAPACAQSAHSFNSGMNCYGVWRLPDTGQTMHYSTAAGDDSNYRPLDVQPSYTVYYGGIETSSYTVDNITGLMWVTNPKDISAGQYVSSGTYIWEDAIAKCEGLSYAGYADWRLPNIKELESIIDYSRTSPSINAAYFLNTASSYYLSSTTYVQNTGFDWCVNFVYGNVTNCGKTSTGYYVRCVRGGR